MFRLILIELKKMKNKKQGKSSIFFSLRYFHCLNHSFFDGKTCIQDIIPNFDRRHLIGIQEKSIPVSLKMYPLPNMYPLSNIYLQLSNMYLKFSNMYLYHNISKLYQNISIFSPRVQLFSKLIFINHMKSNYFSQKTSLQMFDSVHKCEA